MPSAFLMLQFDPDAHALLHDVQQWSNNPVDSVDSLESWDVGLDTSDTETTGCFSSPRSKQVKFIRHYQSQ